METPLNYNNERIFKKNPDAPLSMIISLKMIDKEEFSSFQNQQFLIEEDPKSDKLYMYLL